MAAFGFETRREYIPVGLTVASMLPTVSKPNAAIGY